MSRFKARLAKLELDMHQEECVIVNPQRFPSKPLTEAELDDLRERVRRVARNPKGIILIRDPADGSDPVAALLGEDDPTVDIIRRMRTQSIERSYGHSERTGR